MVWIEVDIDNERISMSSFLYELEEEDIQEIFNQLDDDQIIQFILKKEGESALKDVVKYLFEESVKNSG